MTKQELEEKWQNIDWTAYEQALANMQREIAIAASREHSLSKVRYLQKQLVNSLQAKSLAVRHVCGSKAGPGIDNVIWETDSDKMRAVLSLNQPGYQSKPMKLKIINPKDGGKTRHIHVPVVTDRAMHTLYAFALDAVAESWGDKKSMGFRKGRSQADVHATLMKSLQKRVPPTYIVKTDIKACYASISHQWLLDRIPMDRDILRQFLQCGHVFGGDLFPPDDFGITLGSTLSPILANMTLDGIQTAIYQGLHKGQKNIDYTDGDATRFADDLIVTARTKESAEQILEILNSFMRVRGLTLSPTKTLIIKLKDGFDFLSRNYQYKEGYVYATPSKAAVAKMERSVTELIDNYSGSQKLLIDKLNQKLVGWANYHRVTEATAAFRHIDNVVRASLLALCERLYPKTKRKKIIEKFFYMEPDGEHVYILEHKPDVRVHRIAKTILVKHQPIHVSKNPYIDTAYFEKRTKHREIAAVTGDYKAIWQRQGGNCYYCGGAIRADDRRDVVMMNPALRENIQNLAYVHEHCKENQAEFYRTESEITSDFDLLVLLTSLNENSNDTKRNFLYQPLLEHFKRCEKAVFTLTFAEIEEILGRELCDSAYIQSGYWLSESGSKICLCWLLSGYKVRKVYLKAKKITFERCEDLGTSAKLPAFMFKPMPQHARAEVNIFCKYLKGKYGL